MQRGFDVGEDAVGTVSAYQNPEVFHPQGLEGVQLPDKAVIVAAFPLGSQDGSIPEIGANIRI